MKGFSNQANNTSKVENFTQWLEEIIGLRLFEINVLLELHLIFFHTPVYICTALCVHACLCICSGDNYICPKRFSGCMKSYFIFKFKNNKHIAEKKEWAPCEIFLLL